MQPEWTAGGLAASVQSLRYACEARGRRSKNEEEGMEKEGHQLLSPFPCWISWFLDFSAANFTECKKVLTICIRKEVSCKNDHFPPKYGSTSYVHRKSLLTPRGYENIRQSPLINQNLISARALHFLYKGWRVLFLFFSIPKISYDI